MQDSEYDYNENENQYIDPTNANNIELIKNYMQSHQVSLPDEPPQQYVQNTQEIKFCPGKILSMLCYNFAVILLLWFILYKIIRYVFSGSCGNNDVDDFNNIVKSNRVFTLRDATPSYRLM